MLSYQAEGSESWKPVWPRPYCTTSLLRVPLRTGSILDLQPWKQIATQKRTRGSQRGPGEALLTKWWKQLPGEFTERAEISLPRLLQESCKRAATFRCLFQQLVFNSAKLIELALEAQFQTPWTKSASSADFILAMFDSSKKCADERQQASLSPTRDQAPGHCARQDHL